MYGTDEGIDLEATGEDAFAAAWKEGRAMIME